MDVVDIEDAGGERNPPGAWVAMAANESSSFTEALVDGRDLLLVACDDASCLTKTVET